MFKIQSVDEIRAVMNMSGIGQWDMVKVTVPPLVVNYIAGGEYTKPEEVFVGRVHNVAAPCYFSGLPGVEVASMDIIHHVAPEWIEKI